MKTCSALLQRHAGVVQREQQEKTQRKTRQEKHVENATANKNVKETLRQVFGFDSFRPNQQKITEALLSGTDVFAAMPTGGGKSLCYQLPAVLLPGVTVVISPLISLMKDQVDAAVETGISAVYINSSQSSDERRNALAELASGQAKLLYISPERFALGSFEHLLKNADVSLIAIDEAHCLSEWGHDFRPDYLQLANLRDVFPNVPLAAFTATATRRVQSDILKILKLKNPCVVRASFDRQELFYKVERKDNVMQQIASFVIQRQNEAGIVYRTTRKDVENTVAHLKAAGIQAAAYHAGLGDAERRETQDLFNRDEIKVVVATIAFGMGIDKSNIRYIVHGDLPKNVEGYYQETGRAGRDGEKAECLLLFSRGDAAKINYFIQQMNSEAEKEKAAAALNTMLKLCGVNVCRRKQLLEYFDEEHPGNCGACDVCSGETETEDASTSARMFLSAVIRTGERFGFAHILDVVRGADNAKIKKFGHHKLQTWGVGKDKSRKYWSRIADELSGQGCIFQDRNKYNAVCITEKGREILFGREEFFITLVTEDIEKERKSSAKSLFAAETDNYDQDLFEKLKSLRMELARKKGVPPYIIFSDKTLHHMSARFPVTMEEFLQINGVGEVKAEQYGTVFLDAIKNYKAELAN